MISRFDSYQIGTGRLSEELYDWMLFLYNEKKMMERARILVTGRVQGVLFRDFTQRWASSLGLTGWVRNIADGRVEVLLEGEKHRINQMTAKLWQGPQMARVDDVELKWQEYKGEYSDFRITW